MTLYTHSAWTPYAVFGSFAVAVLWPMVFGLLWWLSPVRINNWDRPDALNIQVTSRRKDLHGSKLTLVSLEWLDTDRGYFRTIKTQELAPFCLVPDAADLPKGKTRTFQLIRFTNQKTDRSILASPGGQFQLPCDGTWKYTMDLRWSGDSYRRPIVRYIKWNGESLPKFCNKP